LTSGVVDPVSKIMDWDRAVAWRGEQQGRVVFTNGVFDLLHPGHIDVLLASRRQGDALVVGVNSDASVKRLKGSERPIRSLPDRAYVLETGRVTLSGPAKAMIENPEVHRAYLGG